MVAFLRVIFALFVFLDHFDHHKTSALAFVSPSSYRRQTVTLAANKLTPLPSGLSPFEKSRTGKNLDSLGIFRTLAAKSIRKALGDGIQKIEVEFPPFLGDNKSQFDDYDNLSELDTNRDWCVQLLPLLQQQQQQSSRTTWLVFPDDKECELAAVEWTGQLYRSGSTKFTSIRGACAAVHAPTTKAWGTTLAETVNKLQGGDGILADTSKIDTIVDGVDGSSNRLHLVCQPGNGGPVEDWINVEALHGSSSSTNSVVTTCIVNGALDKVRDGYYPAIFFPALAKTMPFYKSFESVFFAKPITDKGYAGWLFRCYPEPWQVVLQTPVTTTRQNGGGGATTTVQNTVVLESTTRPSYMEATKAMMAAATVSTS